MVTIQEILPSSSLSQLVMNYSLVKFETGPIELAKPWHAMPKTSLVFFLEDTPICLEEEKTCLYVNGSHHIWVQGLNTTVLANNMDA